MNKNLEIEAKSLLNPNEYTLLKPLFKGIEYIQTNFYIDTKDLFLLSQGITFRIRIKEKEAEYTIKMPQSEGKMEYNFPLKVEEAIRLSKHFSLKNKEIETLLSRFVNISELEILTSLKTSRIDFPYKNGVLSLDKNCYNGICDYEIEYESNSMSNATTTLKSFLENNGIKKDLIVTSKFKRAINSLKFNNL